MSRIEGNSEAVRWWGGEAGAQRINYSRRDGSVTSFCCKKWELSPRQTGNTAMWWPLFPVSLLRLISARAGKQVNSAIVQQSGRCSRRTCGWFCAARLANDCTTFCPTTTQYANTAGQISKMLNMHLQARLVIWAKLVKQNNWSSSRS